MHDSAAVARIFRKLNREVWIVTAAVDPRRRGGLLATWLSQASLDEAAPTVIAGIASHHFTAELIDQTGLFVAHLLPRDAAQYALPFALTSGRDVDKLAARPLKVSPLGAPVLAYCLAWMECRVFARLDAGDRNFYWADVTAGEIVAEGEPLGEQELLRAASVEQRARLAADLRRDAQLQRPLSQAWRDRVAAGESTVRPPRSGD